MKGSLLDVLYVVVMLFGIALVAILGHMLTGVFQETSLNDTTTGAAAFEKSSESMLLFDYLIPFIVFCSGTAVVASAYFIRSHPAFFPVLSIAFIVVVAVTPMLANTFFEVALSEDLNASAQNFPNTFNLFNNLPLVIAVFALLTLIALVGKPSSPPGVYG